MKIGVLGSQGRLGNALVEDCGYFPIFADITNLNDLQEKIYQVKPDLIINCAAFSISEEVYVPIMSILGTRSITFSDLWKEQSRKNSPIKLDKDIEVITLRGNQTKALSFYCGEGQWLPIRKVIRHWYNGNMIKLEQKWGEIVATPNHSIYSANLSLSVPQDNPELLAVRTINFRQRKTSKSFSYDRLLIYAAYITEGSTYFNRANDSYVTSISQADRDWLKEVGEALKREFGVSYSITNKCWGAYNLVVSNKNLFTLLRKECGYKSENKQFASTIFDLPIEQIMFFWNVLLFGDGTPDGRYVTTSYKLANQLSLLLSILGKKFKIVASNPLNKKKSWEFKTNLENHIGLVNKKISYIKYSGWVYDLEIDKSHNFACGMGNIVCHNTDVDGCEINTDKAYKVNFTGVANLLKVFPDNIIHLSTDYIFNGRKGNYPEWTEPAPLGYYGLTKMGAEQLVRMYAKTFTIVRTTILFGSQKKSDFVQNILKQLDEGKPFTVTTAFKGNPTYVRDLAKAFEKLIELSSRPNVINLASSDILNRYELAVKIAEVFQKDVSLISSVNTFTGIAKRPRNAGLDTSLAKTIGLPIHSVQTHLLDFKRDRKLWK